MKKCSLRVRMKLWSVLGPRTLLLIIVVDFGTANVFLRNGRIAMVPLSLVCQVILGTSQGEKETSAF